MQIRTYVFLLVSCFSSVALAQNSQNSKFAGPYAQFGVGYQTASPSFSNTSLSAAGQSLSPNISVSNASSFTGTFAAGYNFLSGTPLLLGLGIEYTPFPTSDASASASYSGSVGTYQNSASVHINNSLNIFLAPGLALDQPKRRQRRLRQRRRAPAGEIRAGPDCFRAHALRGTVGAGGAHA